MLKRMRREPACALAPAKRCGFIGHKMHTLHENMSHDVDDRITLHASMHASGITIRIQSEAGCAQ